MKNKKIIIVGLSNNAKLAAFYFTKDTDYEVVGFAVNADYKTADRYYNLPIFEIENMKAQFPSDEFDVFVAVGYSEMNTIRQSLYNQMKEMGYFLPNYISPKCSFYSEETIGDNNFILEDNTIQPFTKIGSNNVLWSGNHIGHDVIIGDHNFITSHVVVSGFTEIKDNCFLGVNATLRDNIIIADKTLIAAGAVIMKDTKEGEVYLAPKAILFNKKSIDVKIS